MFFKNGSMIEKRSDVTTSGGTETLVAGSSTYIRFTGTSAHTLKLPDGTTMPNGRAFKVKNDSTGEISVQDNGSNVIDTIPAGESKVIMLFSNATANGDWDLSVGGGGVTPLSEEESAQFDAAGARGFSAQSRVLKFNPEEIGGNFWTTRAPVSVAKCWPSNFTMSGFVYYAFGVNNVPANTTTNERYDTDNNYYLSRASGITAANTRAPFVVGGYAYVTNGDPSINATERYDDVANSWLARTAVGTAYYGLASFALGDLGFIAGGTGGGATLTFAYDGVLNAWYPRADIPSVGRTGQGSSEYSGYGHVVSGTSVATVRRYDHVLNSWGTIASTSVGHAHGAVAAVSGSLLVSGGENTGGTATTTVEKFLEGAGAWQTVAPNSQARVGCGAQFADLFMHISGGIGTGTAYTTVESYTSSSFFNLGSLKKSTDVPTSISVAVLLNALTPNVPVQLRTDGDAWKSFMSAGDVLKLDETLSAKFSPSGMIYVTAGDNNGTSSNANRRFDDVANSWTSRANVTVAKRYNNAFAIGSIAYLPGGWAGTEVATNYAYDDLVDTWSTKASLPEVRRNAACFSIEGLGYVSSGWTTAVVNSMRRYSATTDAWTSMSNLDTALSLPGSCESQGMGYRFGGTTNDASGGLLNTASRYNATADAWSARANLGSTRGASSVFSIENYPYICGSFTAGSPISTVDRYNADLNTYTTMSSLPAVRAFGGASRSPGYGFMQGGFDGSSGVATNYRFNPYLNAWETRTAIPANTQNQGCNLFAPAPYYNYEVRVGVPAFYAGVGSYTWVARTNMPTADRLLILEQLAGRVWKAGGVSTDATYIFDSSNNTWVTSTPYGSTGVAIASTVLAGHIVAMKTSNSQKIEDLLRAWTSIANIPDAKSRVSQGSGSSLNGFAYVYGASAGVVLNATYQYDLALNSYTAKANMLASGRDYPAGLGIDGFINVVGGRDSINTTSFSSGERYNDAANSWSSIASLGTAQGHQASIPTEGSLTAAGGFTTGVVGTVYEYRPIGNFYIQKTSLSSSREHSAGASIEGGGIIAGGNNGADLSLVEMYAASVKQAVLSAGLTVS